MKKLSEFLARQLIDRGDYFGPTAEQEYETEIKLMTADFQKYIEAYKKHLKDDSPKTANWAMRENELITALERMESDSHSDELENKEAIEIDKSNCLGCTHVYGCDKIPETCMHFESNENKCDFENQNCSGAYKYKCQCGHLFNKPCIVDSYGGFVRSRCPECKSANFIEY